MSSVDQYISQFEPEIQERLQHIRQLLLEAGAEESMRYDMPAYKVGSSPMYFAAYKKHIGFYPVYGLPELEADMLPYRAKGTKSTLHFMHNAPIPTALLKEIIRQKGSG